MKKLYFILSFIIILSCTSWKEGQKSEDNFIEPPSVQLDTFSIKNNI